jgi:ketosteroid isomerase-like protein
MTTSSSNGSAAEREQIVHGVMGRWGSAIDAREIEAIANLFTEDAIFQGLRPYSVGRESVAAYYASQPIGLQAAFTVVETRRVAEDGVLAYLSVDFSFADRPTLSVHLSVLLERGAEGWLIGHYQVSKLD